MIANRGGVTRSAEIGAFCEYLIPYGSLPTAGWCCSYDKCLAGVNSCEWTNI